MRQNAKTWLGGLALVTAGIHSAWPAAIEDAQLKMKSGDFSGAVAILKPLTQEGDARATGLLGMLMLSGQGISKDVSEGERLLRLSADQGNAGAQGVLAMALWTGDGLAKDRAAAWPLAEQSAAKANALGEFALATMKLSETAPESKMAAVELLQKSADHGLPLAQYQLGKLTALGWVVARDRRAGAALMERGAEQAPQLRARVELINALVPKFDAFVQKKAILDCTGFICAGRWGANRAEAKSFYSQEMWPELVAVVLKVGFPSDMTYFYLGRAAEGMGFLDAASSYYSLAPHALKCAGLINNCDGLEPSSETRDRHAQVRQQLQTEKAQEAARLALAAQEAEDRRRQEEEQRRKALMLAVQQETVQATAGDVDAQHRLAIRYFAGVDVDRDPIQAARWLERAAALGDGAAMSELGERLLHGRDIELDEKRAEVLLKQARAKGDSASDGLLQELADRRRQRAEVLEAQRADKARQEKLRQEEAERKRRAESAAKVNAL